MEWEWLVANNAALNVEEAVEHIVVQFNAERKNIILINIFIINIVVREQALSQHLIDLVHVVEEKVKGFSEIVDFVMIYAM